MYSSTAAAKVNAQIAYDSMHGWESMQAQLPGVLWRLLTVEDVHEDPAIKNQLENVITLFF